MSWVIGLDSQNIALPDSNDNNHVVSAQKQIYKNISFHNNTIIH